ncbi:MAG: hypothetical protein A3E80_04750 [Chlamydiae bacterium RIFCSPHIGHO2_12_FULL_49_9]|nr:MAG: hypothetical protein A3E80_04750 [Chlamydiae bacterium RIFCSPHIGHO2_12_FULL_49_9]
MTVGDKVPLSPAAPVRLTTDSINRVLGEEVCKALPPSATKWPSPAVRFLFAVAAKGCTASPDFIGDPSHCRAGEGGLPRPFPTPCRSEGLGDGGLPPSTETRGGSPMKLGHAFQPIDAGTKQNRTAGEARFGRWG